MKVKDLIAALRSLNQDKEIVLARDSEGNYGVRVLREVSEGMYSPENAGEYCEGEIVDSGGEDVVILFPH